MSRVSDKPAPAQVGEGLHVLVIDDNEAFASAMAETLERVGYECTVATSGVAGARLIDQETFDVILTDLKMNDLDGLAILRKAREVLPEAEVVMITGYGDVKTAVEAIKQGASNYLTKPPDKDELRAIVEKASERVRVARVNRDLKRLLDEKFGFEGVVGGSPQMHDLIKRLQAIAPTNATVLILGETGTGKELVAHAIHNNSPRKNKAFIALNCTALNENLLDAELFGHEAGAFTGADRMRKGRFEAANGGTLFLDEVGDMPLPLQAKLLRVLENSEIVRIGSNDPIKVNVRVVSATHRDLEAAVADGSFRQDLYFRLNRLKVRIPPLRERREDIPLLTARFIKDFNEQHGKQVRGVAEPLRRALATYEWPGNVRQLRNFIEGMVVLDVDGILNLDDVPDETDRERILGKTPAGGGAVGSSNLIGRPLAEVERYYSEQALALTDGNREEAAHMLGIGERTLYRKIVEWKRQDKLRDALSEAHGDAAKAAAALGMDEEELHREIKKSGTAE
jgi:two-component system response regulator HydG